MKIDVLILSWMEFLSIVKGQRPRTVSMYESVLKAFIVFLVGHGIKDVAEATSGHIDEWMKALFYDHGNISNHSRASKLSALRSFYEWMKREGHVRLNPAMSVPSPKFQQTSTQIFTDEQIISMLASPGITTSGIRDKAILVIFIFAGARVGEVINMDISHISDTNSEIYLRLIGKGGKARTVAVLKDPAAHIRHWLMLRRGLGTDHQALFTSLQNKKYTRLSVATYNQVLRKHSKGLAGKNIDIYLHKLRATYATMLYRNGVGIYEIAAAMGHSDIKTTMRYIVIAENYLKKAVIPGVVARKLLSSNRTAAPDRRFNEIEEG